MAGHVRVIAQKIMDERGIMDTDVRDVSTVLRMGISLGSPRACLRADALASHPLCSFVHVNCDDLTATTFGVSKQVTLFS